jgi:hypothetical protein
MTENLARNAAKLLWGQIQGQLLALKPGGARYLYQFKGKSGDAVQELLAKDYSAPPHDRSRTSIRTCPNLMAVQGHHPHNYQHNLNR